MQNATSWTNLKCNNPQRCTKLLLVADPQLIGYQHEPFGLTTIAIWDSDRYLSKTFRQAFDFTKPDIVIFLGDLFDEGSIATNEEYHKYGRRFYNLFFQGDAKHVKHIFLPGDNDIGGEGRDLLTSQKIIRFERLFSQPDVIEFRNITFYKINRLLHTIPKLPQRMEFFEPSKLVIGLSHIPLMFIPSPFVEKLLNRMQPHLLFTAHEHKSMIVSTNAIMRDARQIIPITKKTNLFHTVSLGVADMYEIMVPTCSYRMGTNKMGYGYAIIEDTDLKYTVLWSPQRFIQLFAYAIGVGIFLLFSCFKLFRRCMRKL